MAKKKKARIVQMPLSPSQYIKTKARQLPIHECLISYDWDESGIADVLVARRHKNGKITCGFYLVDLLCLGVKDTFFVFSLTPDDYENLKEEYDVEEELEACDYEVAHNVIYGAVDFAAKYDFEPHEDFAVTQYLLEADDENIEFLDIPFGEDGQPCVVTTVDEEPAEIIAQLEKTAGAGNYQVIYIDDNDFDELDDENYDDNLLNWTEEDWKNFMKGTEDLSDEKFIKIVNRLYDEIFAQQTQSSDKVVPDKLVYHQYKVNFEAIDFNYFSSNEERNEAEKILDFLMKRKSKKAIALLQDKLKQYPGNPIYYNYLSNAYALSGDLKAADQVIVDCYKKFPDYLFGKISYAQYLLDKDRIDEIPPVFDNKFELQAIYPDRKEFHVSEVINFCAIMCRYFTITDDLRTAEVYSKILRELADKENPILDIITRALTLKKLEKLLEVIDNSKSDFGIIDKHDMR